MFYKNALCSHKGLNIPVTANEVKQSQTAYVLEKTKFRVAARHASLAALAPPCNDPYRDFFEGIKIKPHSKINKWF
jgi:hypothetical protein